MTARNKKIASIALLVKNYDDAIDFYTRKLDFELVEDVALGDGKRWVLISPANANETCLNLVQASSAEALQAVGNQAGGQVFMILHTDDFWRDYQQMYDSGVVFCEAPREELYGTVAIFEDLYGNKWDLLEPK